MRVIVAGPRSFTDYEVVADAIESAPFTPTHIITGGANGVDTLAERWADENSVSKNTFKPDYDSHPGQVAPLKRNEKMAKEGEALIAVWNGESSGTQNMIEQAEKAGLEIYTHPVEGMTTLGQWESDST